MPHGVYKLLGGAKGLAAGLASRGAPAPIALAWCATLAEAVGGLLVAIGLLTRPAAAAACVTMVVAWSTSHLGDAIRIGTAKGGVFEYPLLLSVLFLTIALAGPGRYSVDARI
jgi:putative oxidoreductase